MNKISDFIKSHKGIRDIVIYLFVGGAATVTEWVLFYFFSERGSLHYIPGTAIAFLLSTLVNWVLGRLLLFKKREGETVSAELIKIYGVSILGLIFNTVLMYIFVDFMSVGKMPAKIMTTGIVFIWNYISRRFFVYKNTK